MIFNIFHYIFGYVELRAENGFNERFINICTAEGIPLWNIRKTENCLCARTSVGGYKKIRIPARKSGMKVRMIKKYGLPFFLFRHRDRTGLLIGFAVMFIALMFLSGHVWIIEVTGNTTVSDESIESAFAQAGLTLGCRENRLAIPEIKADALSNLNEVSWATVNVRGCTAVIEVREATESPNIEEESGTSNLTASKDGQVEIIAPYRGTAAVKPGQTVMKGDLLVSGVTESRLQTYLFSDAKGYVVARTGITSQAEKSSERTVYIPNERKVYSLCFLGKVIPLGASRDSELCYTHKSWMYIGGKRMPFGIFYSVYTDFSEQEETADKEEVLLSAMNKYALLSYNETLHTQVISENATVNQNTDSAKITGKFECFENIGKRTEFEIEELPENNENHQSQQMVNNTTF